MNLEYTTVDGATDTVSAETLLVDADGTLLRGYEEALYAGQQRKFQEEGWQCPPFEEMRGRTGQALLEIVLRAQESKNRERLKERWGQILDAVQRDDKHIVMSMFPDAFSFFSGHRAPAAIVTNSRRESWTSKMGCLPEGQWVAERFHVVTVSCVEGKAKPDPAMVHRAWDALGRKSAILVGDSEPDAQAGVAAGVRTFILRRGRPERAMRPFRGLGVQIIEDFSAFRAR